MAYGLGDPTESSPEYKRYAADVAALGGLAVRLPAQSGYEGQLGARFPRTVIESKNMKQPLVWTTGRQYGYYLAPKSLRVSDYIQSVKDAATIRAGETAATAESIAKGVLGVSTLLAVALGLGITVAILKRK